MCEMNLKDHEWCRKDMQRLSGSYLMSRFHSLRMKSSGQSSTRLTPGRELSLKCLSTTSGTTEWKFQCHWPFLCSSLGLSSKWVWSSIWIYMSTSFLPIFPPCLIDRLVAEWYREFLSHNSRQRLLGICSLGFPTWIFCNIASVRNGTRRLCSAMISHHFLNFSFQNLKIWRNVAVNIVQQCPSFSDTKKLPTHRSTTQESQPRRSGRNPPVKCSGCCRAEF